MVRAEGVFFCFDNVDIAVNLEIASLRISCSGLSGFNASICSRAVFAHVRVLCLSGMIRGLPFRRSFLQ